MIPYEAELFKNEQFSNFEGNVSKYKTAPMIAEFSTKVDERIDKVSSNKME